MPSRERRIKLAGLLEDTRPAVESALAEAERELARLNARRRRLETLIARARVLIADDKPKLWSEPGRRLTLHAAMEQVLGESETGSMTVHELAREINERHLYEKRDGSDVDPSQVHSRANKYRHLFEKAGARIRLASS